MYSIVQVSSKGERVYITRAQEADLSAAYVRKSLLEGTEHESFIIVEL